MTQIIAPNQANATHTIAVIGLGYVGLPLALSFAKHFPVIGYDIDDAKISAMQEGVDPSKELSPEHFEDTRITFTNDATHLAKAQTYFVCVPTGLYEDQQPDLTPLELASSTIGRVLSKGDTVIFESTVFPGCTEEVCLPLLEKHSTLVAHRDFSLAYSPERIVPGDPMHSLKTVQKVVGANDELTAQRVASLYQVILDQDVYIAPSIQVAEAAKIVENIQRDINISLINELAIVFHKMGINTQEVLKAAKTKWNFHAYSPGLVGGHCINIDPFYFLYKARQLGHEPQVIAAGRNVNDSIPQFIAKALVDKLSALDKKPKDCRVLVHGITFKENVADIRHSKVIDLVHDLKDHGLQVDIIDPHADATRLEKRNNLTLSPAPNGPYDAVIVAVAHTAYRSLDEAYFLDLMPESPILFDVKACYATFTGLDHWTL